MFEFKIHKILQTGKRIGHWMVHLIVGALVCVKVNAGVTSTGDFSDSIQFDLPAAKHAAKPVLGLGYSSGNTRTGVAGIGWTLSGVPSIARHNSGSGILFNGNDSFIGPHGELTKTTGNQYRPKNGTKAIYRWVSDGVWTITENGSTATYSQAEASAGTHVRWWLTEFINANNSAYTIDYTTKGGHVYPETVKYNNVVSGGTGVVTVTFEYSGADNTSKSQYIRNDQIRQVDLNILKTLSHRLSGVDIAINGVTYKNYNFSYLDKLAYSRLEKIEVESYVGDSFTSNTLKVYDWLSDIPQQGDGSGSDVVVLKGCVANIDCQSTAQKTINPVSLSKSQLAGVDDEAQSQPVKLLPESTLALRSGTAQIKYGDFNGDGITDIYKMQNGYDVVSILASADAQNNQTVTTSAVWGEAQGVPNTPLNTVSQYNAYSDSGYETYNDQMKTRGAQLSSTFVGDFNGDGRDDIYYMPPLKADNDTQSDTVYLSNGSGFDSHPVIYSGSVRHFFHVAYEQRYKPFLIDKGFAMSMVRQGDFDGDQKSDFIWFYSDMAADIRPTGGPLLFKRATIMNNGHLEGNNFAFGRYFVSDEIGHYDGTSQQGERVISETLSAIKIADYNGDGRSDVYMAHPNSTHQVHLSSDGDLVKKSVLEPRAHHKGAESDDQRTGRYLPGDFNGDGITDMMVVHEQDPISYFCPVLFGHQGQPVHRRSDSPNCDGTAFSFTYLYSASLSRVRVTDYNGDGFSDLVIIFGDHQGDDYVWLSNGTPDTNQWTAITVPSVSVSEFGDGYNFNPSTRDCNKVHTAWGHDSSTRRCEAMGVHLSRYRFADLNGDGMPDRHYVDDADSTNNITLSKRPKADRILGVKDVATATTTTVGYDWMRNTSVFPQLMNVPQTTVTGPNLRARRLVSSLKVETQNSSYGLNQYFDYEKHTIGRGTINNRRDLGVAVKTEKVKVIGQSGVLNETKTYYHQDTLKRNLPYEQKTWSKGTLKTHDFWAYDKLTSANVVVNDSIDLVIQVAHTRHLYPLARGLSAGSESGPANISGLKRTFLADISSKGSEYPQCPEEWEWDPVLQQCVHPGVPDCPEGQVYNAAAGGCVDEGWGSDTGSSSSVVNEYVTHLSQNSDFDAFGFATKSVTCVGDECMTRFVNAFNHTDGSGFDDFSKPLGRVISTELRAGTNQPEGNLLAAQKWTVDEAQRTTSEQSYVCQDATACTLSQSSWSDANQFGWRTMFSDVKFTAGLGRVSSRKVFGVDNESFSYTLQDDNPLGAQIFHHNTIGQTIRTGYNRQGRPASSKVIFPVNNGGGATTEITYSSDAAHITTKTASATNYYGHPVSEKTDYVYSYQGDYASGDFTGHLGQRSCSGSSIKLVCSNSYSNGFGLTYKTQSVGEGGKAVYSYATKGYLNNDVVERSSTLTDTSYSWADIAGAGLNWTTSSSRGEDYQSKVEYPGGGEVSYSRLDTGLYDDLSLTVTQKIDATRAAVTSYYYDEQDRIIRVKDAHDKYIWYYYDIMGRLVCTKLQGSSNQSNEDTACTRANRDVAFDTVIEYNSAGEKTAMLTPDSGEVLYRYNQKGQMSQEQYANDANSVIDYRYDAAGRVLQKQSGSLTYINTYDFIDVNNFQAGKLLSTQVIEDKDSANEYLFEKRVWRYDSLGRLRSAYVENAAGEYATGYTGFDHFGSPTSMTLPDGTVKKYELEPYTGWLKSIALTDSEGTEQRTIARYDDYNLMGMPGVRELPDFKFFPVTTNYTYAPDTFQLKTLISNSNLFDVQHNTYEFDYVGNVTALTDGRQYTKLNSGLDTLKHSRSFDYDKLHRLTSFTNTATAQVTTYQYDDLGNITNKGDQVFDYSQFYTEGGRTINGNLDGTTNYAASFNSKGQMTGKTGQGNWSYGYHPINGQLASAQSADVNATFMYDINEQRISKTVGDTVTFYISADFEVEIPNANLQLARQNIYTKGLLPATTNPFGTGIFNKGIFGKGPVISNAGDGCPFDMKLTRTNEWPGGICLPDCQPEDNERWSSYHQRCVSPISTDCDADSQWNEQHLRCDVVIDDSQQEIDSSLVNSVYRVHVNDAAGQRLMSLEHKWLSDEIAGSVWKLANEDSVVSYVNDYEDVFTECQIQTIPAVERKLLYMAFTKVGGINVPLVKYREASPAREENVCTTKQGIDRIPSISSTRDLRIKYFLQDHLGSASVVLDRYGRVASYLTYSPFGEVIEGQSLNKAHATRQFTGQIRDESLGLNYYGARYYDTFAARFTTADSIVPNPYDLQSNNRYAYVLNNPVKYTDPSGHFACAGLCVAAALAGTSFAMDVGMQMYQNGSWDLGKVNWTQAGVAGIMGAIAGPVGGKVSVFAARLTVSGVGKYSLGAILSSMTGAALNGIGYTMNVGAQYAINDDYIGFAGLSDSMAWGAAGGFVGNAAEGVGYYFSKAWKFGGHLRSTVGYDDPAIFWYQYNIGTSIGPVNDFVNGMGYVLANPAQPSGFDPVTELAAEIYYDLMDSEEGIGKEIDRCIGSWFCTGSQVQERVRIRDTALQNLNSAIAAAEDAACRAPNSSGNITGNDYY